VKSPLVVPDRNLEIKAFGLRKETGFQAFKQWRDHGDYGCFITKALRDGLAPEATAGYADGGSGTASNYAAKHEIACCLR